MAVVVATVSPLGAVFLLWLVVSGGIFIYRRVKGIPIRDPKPAVGDDPTGLPSTAASANLLPFSARPAAPPAPATPPMAPPPTAGPGTGPPLAGTDPAPAAAAGPGGYFARTSPAAPEASPGPTRPTVADAVSGIAMPCGLSPVVDGSATMPNPFRVAFLTTTATPNEVGAGIAGELERLGYTLSNSTATELVGHRDSVELRVVLYPAPASAKRGLDPIFPPAAANAVGLELST